MCIQFAFDIQNATMLNVNIIPNPACMNVGIANSIIAFLNLMAQINKAESIASNEIVTNLRNIPNKAAEWAKNTTNKAIEMPSV